MNINEGRNRRNRNDRLRASMNGKPWPPKDILEPAFKSLVNWYTVDEISVFFGRTRYATGQKIASLGVKVHWRKNHKGEARLWQKGEKARLYYNEEYQRKTQPEVARDLGITRNSIYHAWSKLGSKWGQGYISLSDIAKVAGCTPEAVSQRVRKSIPSIAKLRRGNGRSTRYRLTLEQAELVLSKIRPGRVPYLHKVFGD